ncbi:cation channel sperm-associated protein 4-like [Clupea harengus]|uniref:Cation channel sperm-associated protein 4-like n=1 Tax=Clupea harengus TaxID=7950 RepID=A0A6P8GQR3_CLUHA|nr:cation channel sperm-associated protein 4-like [Clupea harengus]
MQGVAVMLHVIMQSLPDLANIFLLLLIIMMVFAVFGVNLFSASVPSAFGDLTVALYTLFICITQDGWMTIYKEFQQSGATLLYGASLYFFIFLTLGAFIFGNLFGAVVTTNLEMCMAELDETKSGNDNALALNQPEDGVSITDTRMVHCEEVVARTSMTKRQKPWKGSCLENLRVDTFEDLTLVLSAMQKNMKEYKEIRQELEKIVEAVHSLPFNREQENAVLMRDHNAATMTDSFLKNEVATGRTGDMLSTLIALEKAHVIDSGTDSPAVFQRGLRHEAMRRMSMDSTNSSAVPHSS